MKKIKNIIISAILITVGFSISCLIQPVLIVNGHDFCMSGGNPDYSLSEVQNINSKIKELGIQDAYAVPYGEKDMKIIVYEFCPWGKNRIDEKYNQIKKFLKPVGPGNEEFQPVK
ncbi:hypothetical protein [Tichowtungia aerotolerans]|uniref:Uncharacterized protein n=1 Tax=Tichowtungia aerotolerans TaxID=2697043 RepID=A0A6P1MB12_9BACT|nr:hypothetical protein [Tichowtungia aerotolerans]QHI68746.1 hypothetical protein GT409_04540 [Tichowtungia aerotolerans]